MFNEDFLHYIWKFKRFNTQELTTTDGEAIQILKTGIHNQDAGPDFFNAQLKIGNTLWAGNVEIHIKSSDWDAHQHQTDAAYNNVILHVVYEHNAEITTTQHQIIPTLELKGFMDKDLLQNYHQLLYSKNKIPCGNQLFKIDKLVFENWLERLLLERLERKTTLISERLAANKNDWEETFYQTLFKYFGLHVNAIPFEQLALQTPLKIMEKHPQLVSIEALLFGQAGFLNDEVKDEYFQRLVREYQFLKSKFRLTSMERVTWKFSKLRPSNFPTIRISQLAMLLKSHTRMFAEILVKTNASDIRKMFESEVSEYWLTHYQFGVLTKKKPKKTGKTMLDSLMINVVSPFLFVYGKTHQQEQYVELALELLQATAAENNHIITSWKNLGITPCNAGQTQALIELKNNYCQAFQCLNCPIGIKLLEG